VTRGRRHGLDALDAALIAAVAIGLLIAAFLLVANPWLPPIHYLRTAARVGPGPVWGYYTELIRGVVTNTTVV